MTAQTGARKQFEYLLNEFEPASQHSHPSTVGYFEKRKALIDYVETLERELAAALASLRERDADAEREREFICKKCGIRQELGVRDEPTF